MLLLVGVYCVLKFIILLLVVGVHYVVTNFKCSSCSNN
jgi:hypothetical protein